MGKNSKLLVDNFRIRPSCYINIKDNAMLILGSGYINRNCTITCYKKIAIGEHVFISNDVIIRDTDSHAINNQPMTAAVTIEDNVWIGTRAIILKGVTIGKGSVIAAGSIVTKDIPPYSLSAGVPAQIIKSDIKWS